MAGGECPAAAAGGVGAWRDRGDRLGHPAGRGQVFCAVLAWCRIRFVRFARDETAATTMAMLAECFETFGGVPAKVLADRMGCLKGGVVANVMIPTPDYVRFATHYGFRPDFCHAHDPESKGIVEHLVGYAKRDVPIPDGEVDLAEWNRVAAAWCGEVNGVVHTETCAVPLEQLEIERLRREVNKLKAERDILKKATAFFAKEAT